MLFDSFHVPVLNFPVLEKLSEHSSKEHVTRADPAIKEHLDNCSNGEHLFSINNLILDVVNTHTSLG